MGEMDQESLLHRVLAISRAIAGQLDYQSVLRQVAGEVHKLFQYDHMDVAIILPDGKNCISYEVGMQTEWGRGTKGANPVVKSPVRSLLLGEVPFLLTGDALIDERFHFEGAFDAPIFDAKLHSRVHVPLYVHGTVMGSLNISSHEKNVYTEEDVVVAHHVADLLASYFFAVSQGEEAKKAAIAESDALNRENMLRLGALRLTEGMEQERKRLGMDLHDQTLADLTRVMRHISRLRRRGTVDIKDLGLLEEEIDICLKELRNIIEDTKPGVLELFGFSQAIEAQLERTVAGISPPITIKVVDKSDALLDGANESLRTTVFRIVQEAINNAVKHSRPSFLRVEISKSELGLRIEVVDNGAGISSDVDMTTGGLDNMKVRASLVSSKIAFFNTADSRGTHVVLDIPFSAIEKTAEEGLNTRVNQHVGMQGT